MQCNLEIKQIKILLADIRRLKMICIDLTDQLDHSCEFTIYDELEVKAKRQVYRLDLEGLKKLKNNLMKHATQLFVFEKTLLFQKECRKKQFTHFQEIEKHLCVNDQFKAFQLPVYSIKRQSGHKKIDRLSSYIQTLNQNMKTLKNTINKDWSKEFYKYDEYYRENRRKIEGFQMKNEEIGTLLQKKCNQTKIELAQSGQIVEENQDFVIIKVQKEVVENFLENLSIQNQKQIKNSASIPEKIQQIVDNQKKTQEQENKFKKTNQRVSQQHYAQVNYNANVDYDEILISKYLHQIEVLKEKRDQIMNDEDLWSKLLN